MNRTRRTSFDKTRVRIQNILSLSQSSQNTKNNGKVDTESATQDSSTSKQRNVGQRKPPKKRGRPKKIVNSKQKPNTTATAKNASKLKTAGRRGRKKGQQSVNDENPAERTTARPRKQYVPIVNARRNTRSRSRHEAEAALNAASTEPIEHLENEREKEKQSYNLRDCAIVINRLTPQEIENVSTVRESENDENITSLVTESQRQLSVPRTESINDELEAQAIQEAAENAPEQSEKNDKVTHETHRPPAPAHSETDDENPDYIQMTMTSEDEGEGDEMPGATSNNNSQHDSVQNGDSGYQTGNKAALSNVQEWLNKSLSPEALSDAGDVPDVVPALPEHEIILNVCRLSETMPSNLTALITKSMIDKEKDSVIPFDRQSQISTHFSETPARSVDNLSVASTHFSEGSDHEHEPISQVAVPADVCSDVTPVNLNKSNSNATTHFSGDEQVLERNTSTISVQMDDFDFTGSHSNRTISVENVSNVSSPKRSRDEEEIDAMDIADEQTLNASEEDQRSRAHIQFSHPILQPRPKRPKTGSMIQVLRRNSEPNRRIVSQPTRDPPEFDPNDFQHSSQPFAIVRARFHLTSQNNNNNNDDDDSLLIDTPSDTDYQDSNHQRFITQPTQLTHMNWGFSRNSSVETILATNSSNVSAIPKYRYNRHQEDQTCFPMVPHTYYNSLVINGGTTFAVNDFDHGHANITHHFLSRFNDSLNGLNANFNGIVYTTNITANLISHYMNVDRSRIIILEFNETIIVENIKVTALELTSWPGATLFAFDTGSNGIILHVGDLRIPADTEGIEYLVLNRIKKFYFDRSCLMKVYYQIPNDIDRYVGLIDQCTKYYQQNITVGMVGMIVIGAFKHGMEPLILHLAEMLHMKVFMDPERRAFLDRMLDNDSQAEDSVHYRLRERVVANPKKAHVHILDVDNINETYLGGYLSNDMNRSFHRMLAIRPRGNGSDHIQLVLNRFIRILDVPNPLVGDYYEYRRFMESVRENSEQEQHPRQLA